MLLPVALFAALLLFTAGLGYFAFLGTRAIFRTASQTARDAGHAPGSAATRAVIRMVIWAAFFGVFYFFLYFLGRTLGWWSLISAVIGGVAMIFSLLQADRLLSAPGAAWRQVGIAFTIVVVLATMISVTWVAALRA